MVLQIVFGSVSLDVAVAESAIGNANVMAANPGLNLPVLVINASSDISISAIRTPVSVAAIHLNTNVFGSAEAVTNVYRGVIWIRGNTSRSFPKKSYRLELQDSAGAECKIPLCGMPGDSDWILNASVTDRSFIRDALTYELWRGMGHYAPHTRYIYVIIVTNEALVFTNHLVLQGLNVGFRQNYHSGLYVLTEKIKRDKRRLDLAKLHVWDTEERNISGGYILRMNNPKAGDRGFKSLNGLVMLFDEPKSRNIPDVQQRWISNYVCKFEEALRSAHFKDHVNGYSKYIDVRSFIDYYWIAEVGRNPDSFWFPYLYKDRGGKLNMGPVWDWDLSFGNETHQMIHNEEGWSWKATRSQQFSWFARLFNDPDFEQLWIDRWSELRKSVFATSNVIARVERLASELGNARVGNAMGSTLSKGVRGSANALKSHEEHVQWLKDWITRRLSWIDTQFVSAPTADLLRRYRDGDGDVALSGNGNAILYTLDGSDPRALGGGSSFTALKYVSPARVSAGAVLFSRVRSSNAWSAPLIVSVPKENAGRGN